LKRVTAVFKKEKKGETNGLSHTTTQNESIRPLGRRSTTASSLGKKLTGGDPSDCPDHSVSRDGIVASFEKFSQVINAANRPLPTSTGDGSYAEDSKQGGFLDDLKVLRVKDLETANTLLKQHLTGTELTDDKTMIMEKTIQVFTARSHSLFSRACNSWQSASLKPS
jgi:hypothetical protein